MNRLRFVPLLVAFLGLCVLAACGEERDPVDRVQPNAIAKTYFDGEWYYQRTAVDVPSGNGFTFVGATDFGGLSIIAFDIQEDTLYVRRNIELVQGADDLEQQVAAGATYEGEVIAAFRIEKHFDIQRDYNPMTGEEVNVLSENSVDRPWWEREYIRVDWSQNLVHDYRFDWDRETLESVPYYVQAEPDPETGAVHPDAPLFEEDGSYFDVTTRIFSRADMVDIPGFGPAPSCWLFGNEFDECGSGEYTIRNSFMRRSGDRQYIPEPYKGPETNLFGFFTSDRMTYDPQEGIRQQNKTRYLNRHNLWATWYDPSQAELPWNERELLDPSERTLRPIVYHVNTEFPDDLKPIAQEVADQWNEVFSEVVTELGYPLAEGERTFILCANNPVREGDPAACGEAGDSPRLGDIRYSFMAYVPKYMQYGLLGLGPSNNDPVTGETISGMAYVYHHNNLAAYDTARMVELLNAGEGSPELQEFVDGVDLTEWAQEVRGESEAAPRTFGLEHADHMVHHLAHGWMAQAFEDRRHELTPADIEAIETHGFDTWAEPRFEQLYRLGVLNGERHAADGRLEQLAGTYIEDLMMTDEHLLAGGRLPGQPVTDAHLAAASPMRGGFARAAMEREYLRFVFAESNNMYLPEMADDALMGFARDYAGTDYTFEELYEAIRTRIYTAVLAHEVGHSIGLMHNFGGSDDAVNYFPEYWEIRSADGTVAPRTEDPITEFEIDNRIYDYGYSSVMDYAGRYTVDGAGIGRYDRAALLFGYGGLMEVFEDASGIDENTLNQWWSSDGDVLTGGGPLGLQTLHYTTLYNRLGERLYDANNRRLVPVDAFEEGEYASVSVDGQRYARVPYIYCSHNSSDLSDHCLTRDAGADSMERMKNILDDLNTWYIMRNFPRGRIGVDTYNYVSRYYGRVFHRLKNWNNLYGLYAALFQQFFTPEQIEFFMTDSRTGFGAKTWAVQNAFNYLVQTLLMPDVGGYGGASLQPDGTRLANASQGLFDVITLGIDDARYYSTDWSGLGGGDGRDCGYMWYECLNNIGFYFDKIMAIEALTDSSTNFVARATPEDIREWEVSFYSTFPEQIAAINEAILTQNWGRVAPYWDGSELQFPNYAGPLDEEHATPVNPFATFTIQLYWQVMGQARFPENYDRSFRQESRIWELGSGAGVDIADDRRITYTHDATGITYAALQMPGVAGAGEQMIRRTQCLATIAGGETDPDAVAAVCPNYDPSDRVPSAANAAFELEQYVELLEILADMAPMMDYGDPYNP